MFGTCAPNLTKEQKKILKQEIKLKIKKIIEDIEYEEYTFNKMFHSDVIFQRSYYKFSEIYTKYGKDAYLKYVPYKYRKQELKSLLNDKNFDELNERYDKKTIKRLDYSFKIVNAEISAKNKVKLFFIRLRKYFSGKFISLPTKTILALPAGISNSLHKKKDDDK